MFLQWDYQTNIVPIEDVGRRLQGNLRPSTFWRVVVVDFEHLPPDTTLLVSTSILPSYSQTSP